MAQDNTKGCLIRAAQALFAKLGFTGTSVKQIADDAGVNVSLVSYHFGGKEGLYKACLETEVSDMTDFFDKYIASFSSKEEYKLKLKMFVEGVVAKHLEHGDVGCIIRRDIEMDPIDPHVLEVFKKTIVPMFERLIVFITKGQKAGYLRSDLAANQVCVLFMGGIQHAIRTDNMRKKLFGVSLKDEKEKQSLIHTAIEIFFNGLDNRATEKTSAVTKESNI
ncbi:MAG: TetR family transcriptional regulator [Bdellovibrionota bacterium]